MIFDLSKRVRVESKAYLEWVRSLPCVVTGMVGCDAHHTIGYRLSTQKHSDLFAFPLQAVEHRRLHDHGWHEWERCHGSQWLHVARTLELAAGLGILTIDERQARAAI